MLFSLLYRPTNIGVGRLHNFMIMSFTSWLNHRNENQVPECDRIVPIIAQAGPQGMNRGQIGKLMNLEREVLDELLAGLVRFGLLTVTSLNGIQVYRAV